MAVYPFPHWSYRIANLGGNKANLFSNQRVSQSAYSFHASTIETHIYSNPHISQRFLNILIRVYLSQPNGLSCGSAVDQTYLTGDRC